MYTRAAIGCFLFLLPFSCIVADVSHLGGSASTTFKHSSGGDIPVVDDLSTRSFNQQSWNIRNNIPGEPNVDYPVYSAPPISSFSCKGRHYGYYADVESRCQVFRVCAQTDLTGTGFAFLCPNGTLFNQKFFVCDWYKNVDCSASETYYSRNNLFGTKMGLMSENDMMTMVQGMVDYTKQSQFNNQNVNNNGGFPFTNSQFPKQSDNSQSIINQNNGLASSGNGNFHGQQAGANQGRSNSNVQPPQRGSDILSQPIFPSENNRLTTPGRTQGTSSFAAPTAVPNSSRYNQNANFNSNNFGGANNENNNQQPTLFVSSLGEISSDQNLRLNPFTTAIVSTRIFDTLSSNVDPVSTSADQVQRLALGQYNQHGNSQSNVQYNTGNGLNNPVSLQQEINHLSESGSNEPNLSQQSQPSSTSNKFEANNGLNSASNSQSDQTLTAVYSGSGDLLSHTISQYSKPTNVQGPAQNFGNGRDPSLSALVNSLGETIYTPIFSGEGNLLSHTIGQKASSENGNDSKPQSKPDAFTTVAKQGIPVSTPQPILQTPLFDSQSRVTIPPFSTSSTSSNVKENIPKTNVVYSGEGNLLSQTIGRKGPINQSTQSSQSSNVYSAESKLSSQSVHQTNTQTLSSQGDQTTSFASSNRFAGNQNTVPNQGTSTGPSSSHFTSVPSTPSYGQKPITPSNVRTNQATTYNSHVSFGQKLSTNSAPISTTSAPYSPSVPPFRSTTATVYTPTASSYHQHTQTYNDQSHRSRSYTHQENGQSVFSNNQFQVPSKEYLPSSDNTRTARTNDLSLGNHGSSSFKLSSSQNNFNQRDGRQQFTYPVDQRNQHRPIRDHETAASNQHSYTYSTGQAQQASHQTYSTYNQYNSYPQQQQQQHPQQQQQQHPQQQQPQHSYHYATIDNRPNPSQTSFQAPPLQSNYPVSIQNNPQSQRSYPSVDNRYIPSAPLPVPSSIPSSLPSIVHPTSQYSTQQNTSFPTNQHNIPRTTSNEKVVVNVIPATGWYLNDPNERQSFLDAVSRGLLSEKGVVYVNNVQSSQRQQPNFNAQQPQGRSQIDIDEEAFFHGSSSYESPLNSVGKLPGDSDSVSAFLDSSTSSPYTPSSSSSSSSPSSGYQYEHPRRSFDV
ncbi:putative uncharacterized protein DDB_G0282133 isoform X2 [Bradysia coprophila]|uniref:putative uncharacterized protein DDB_G0282133 isoform X2 n=1 Tax=Bradysia coprophila TaxID=38358 RepID=UPI00187D8C83|nr:putative uncharacterized protein DDB_G0282133 isoform X2 [Bradysia coprophila]